MRTIKTSQRCTLTTPSLTLVLGVLVALVIIRLIGLRMSAVDLYFDEAQYWAWSRDLAFGYFSKPPLLAWIIAAAGAVCGDGEACVRAASPLFYLGTTLAACAVANELYGRETGVWTALTFAFLLGAIFSARIISTDVPLVFFWAVALLAFIKLMRAPDWPWAIVLGVALGLGLLAKYAMIYFLLCAAVAAVLDPNVRALLKRPQLWVAVGIAALMLAPNVYWNLTNQLVTLRHTGDNISGEGLRFMPLRAIEFVGAQFVVSSPFVFGAFLILLVRSINKEIRWQDWLMLAFAVPPLALVTALAFFRDAHGNWAAPALISATVMVVAWWVRSGDRRWLAATLALGILVQAALLVGDAFADRISIPALGGKADIYQRTLGWRALGTEVARVARAAGTPTVAAEDRPALAALTYYLRDEPRKVVSWPVGTTVQSQFDLTQPLEDTAAQPVLLISGCPHTGRLKRYFTKVTLLPPITARSGPRSARSYIVFKLDGRGRPIGPLGECRETATD